MGRGILIRLRETKRRTTDGGEDSRERLRGDRDKGGERER